MKRILILILLLVVALGTTGCNKTPKNATLGIEYSKDSDRLKAGEFNSIVLDESEYQSKFVIFTDEKVSNFKILSVNWEDYTEDGKIVFKKNNELHFIEEFLPEKPLEVTMTFVGDFPNKAISYIDADGTEKAFAISMSGKDSSLFLEEVILK